MEQPKLTAEQQEMKKSRALAEAELVRRGAEYEETSGALNISEEEEKKLKLENQEVVAENVVEYIKKFKKMVLASGEHTGWDDKEPGYCFFSGMGRFYFLDKDKNWNQVSRIESGKIGSLRTIPKEFVAPFGEKTFAAVKKELADSGFELDPNGNFHALEIEIDQKQKEKTEGENKKKRESFDI